MWNKPFELVMKIKKEYLEKGGDKNNFIFNEWIDFLKIEEYNQFIQPLQINQLDEFILIRYSLQNMQKSMWEDEDSIYRQCRSVVIDLKRESLVLTPMRKFFNIDEVKENKIDIIIDKIKKAKVIEFSNKLDGSMQSYRWYNDKVFCSGSTSLSVDNSWRLKDGYEMLTSNHINMLKDYTHLTFVFEYISLKDSHVVIYDKNDEGLHLISIINTISGEEFDYKHIKGFAKFYGIKCVDVENITIHEVLNKIKTIKSSEKEGWVLNIDGHKIKIKCDDYVQLHRILGKSYSVGLIIESIAENKYDDLISKLPEVYRLKVNDLADKIYEYKIKTESLLQDMYKNIIEKFPDKKDFMMYVDENIQPEYKKYLKILYLKQDINVLKSKNGAYKKNKRNNRI